MRKTTSPAPRRVSLGGWGAAEKQAADPRWARDNGWTIRQILNTHEHGDHTGGNEAVRAATGAKVLAEGQGIEIVLSPTVLLLSAGAVFAMCGLASVPSARKVLSLEATEVFR